MKKPLKPLLCVLVLVISVSLIMVFSLGGCRCATPPEEEHVVEEVTNEPVEEVVDEEVAEEKAEEVETVEEEESDLPLLMDLAQLKLKVTNTEVIDQISTTDTTDVTTISANEGFKLVVVTLRGTVTDPCRITTETTEFSVIYEKEDFKGEKSPWVDVSVAIAKDDRWSIAPVGARVVTTEYIREVGPIILKMAVILPEEINSFYVRYPALAQGKATIY